MALIPVFKDCTREYLMDTWGLEFPLSDWVSIRLPFNKVKELDKNLKLELYKPGDTVELEYETNRYDVKFRDAVMGKNISVYLYMDEDSSHVIAIDGAVADNDRKCTTYPIEETPFAHVLQDIRNLNSKTKGEHKVEDRLYYLDCYNKIVKTDKEEYVKEHGNDENYDSSYVESMLDTDGIVGYYLSWYQGDALEMWLNNCSANPENAWSKNQEVTLILRSLLLENKK